NRPHPCGRRRPENIKARGRQGTKFYFESANADVVGTWRPQHEWQCPAISNVDGQGLSTPQCREMVWLDAESFGLTRDKLNRRPVFSGPLTRKEPVEPQGGIEPPICALPRRRYTPKPLRQRRRPKGGRYLGLSTAIGATRSRDQSLSNARVFATSRTMKASITSFDLRVLVAEWQGLLGGHVDKIYQQWVSRPHTRWGDRGGDVSPEIQGSRRPGRRTVFVSCLGHRLARPGPRRLREGFAGRQGPGGPDPRDCIESRRHLRRGIVSARGRRQGDSSQGPPGRADRFAVHGAEQHRGRDRPGKAAG